MKIYVGHSKDINYINELYKPVKEYEKNTRHIFILPHENNVNSNNTRDFYNNIDLFIAEVTMPSTGLGIELGWAFDSNVPIVCISKKGNRITNSLKSVTNEFYKYNTDEELINIINLIIVKYNK